MWNMNDTSAEPPQFSVTDRLQLTDLLVTRQYRRTRRAARISAGAAAREIGVSRQSYNRWERGTGNPDDAHAAALLAMYWRIAGNGQAGQ